jgi:hypothetical protein
MNAFPLSFLALEWLGPVPYALALVLREIIDESSFSPYLGPLSRLDELLEGFSRTSQPHTPEVNLGGMPTPVA